VSRSAGGGSAAYSFWGGGGVFFFGGGWGSHRPPPETVKIQAALPGASRPFLSGEETSFFEMREQSIDTNRCCTPMPGGDVAHRYGHIGPQYSCYPRNSRRRATMRDLAVSAEGRGMIGNARNSSSRFSRLEVGGRHRAGSCDGSMGPSRNERRDRCSFANGLGTNICMQFVAPIARELRETLPRWRRRRGPGS